MVQTKARKDTSNATKPKPKPDGKENLTQAMSDETAQQNDQYEVEVEKLKRAAEMYKAQMRSAFNEKRVELAGILHKTVGELRQELNVTTPMIAHSILSSTLMRKPRNDEGYVSTSDLTTTTTKSMQVQFTIDTVDNEDASTLPNQTPAMNKSLAKQAMAMGLVTPKINHNKTVSAIRHPKCGETVISMDGSPLYIPVQTSNLANINIPSKNGALVTLLPSSRIRMSEIPQVDANVKEQLQILVNNLQEVIKRGDSVEDK